MCPNCILNQAPLDTGLYVAFGVCIVFFIMAVAAMWWAFGNGDFEDIESTKFDMLDDSEEGRLGEIAKNRVERLRANKQSS